MTGTCGHCGRAAQYITTPRSGYWIHIKTQSHISMRNGRHDVNTHIVREKAKP